MMSRPRVAFVDLIFSWPPNGGADADLFHVAGGLQDHGFETRLFVVHEEGSQERGVVRGELPFPVTVLPFTREELRPENLAKRLREAVDAWAPEAVFLAHGFALKPHAAQALAHHRLVGRFYAHELTCARDAFRFKDGGPCPKDFLRTPEFCRQCAANSLAPEIRSGKWRTWVSDYVAAKAWRPEHHRETLEALAAYKTVIVSNRAIKAELDPFHGDVVVVPGGASFPKPPVTGRRPLSEGAKKVILMAGRADDPLKGLQVLLEAGRMLSESRDDFEIWATHFDVMDAGVPWYRPLGWLTHEETLDLYYRADIAVVPSVWHEPFGLAAVEAMVAAAPVVASRSGGLADIVRDGETGLLVPPGDARALAEALARLLDDAALRGRMGQAGWLRAHGEYDWCQVLQKHYLPLLERLCT